MGNIIPRVNDIQISQFDMIPLKGNFSLLSQTSKWIIEIKDTIVNLQKGKTCLILILILRYFLLHTSVWISRTFTSTHFRNKIIARVLHILRKGLPQSPKTSEVEHLSRPPGRSCVHSWGVRLVFDLGLSNPTQSSGQLVTFSPQLVRFPEALFR